MSSELLCSLQQRLTEWAMDNATWTGHFSEQPITLSPIYPLYEIEHLTLHLGNVAIPLTTPNQDIELKRNFCGCCFDIQSKKQIWCRFQACQSEFKTRIPIQHLFSRVQPKHSILQQCSRLILFKNTAPISFLKLAKYSTIQSWSCHHIHPVETITIASHLSQVVITHCDQLLSVENLENCHRLENLSIEWCTKLQHIHTFAPNLQTLKIHWCSKLHQLAPLIQAKLHSLSIQACHSLESLPNVDHCPMLESIRFCWFSQQIALPDLSQATRLRFLFLRAISSMLALPQICTDRLELIDVAESNALTKIAVQGLRLRSIIADGCGNLEVVNVRDSQHLRTLSLARVPKLQEIKGLVENSSIQDLQISDAPNLSHLDGLETNFDLRKLTLVNCAELTHLPNWRRLIQLTHLKVYGCPHLKELPNHQLPSLESLKMGGCSAMRELAPCKNFPNLKHLKWSSFTGTEKEMDLSALTHLQHLSILGHPNIVSIRGIEKMQNLQIVDFGRCPSLQKIDGLGQAHKVQAIRLQGCRSLHALPPLFDLRALEELSLSYCHELRRLDCLYNHPHLKLLNISDCPNLNRLPLLHPKTQESIRQFYCNNLPQSIDISKVVGDALHPSLREIHIENSNVLSLDPLLKCVALKEIMGIEVSTKWMILLKLAIQRKDADWIAEYWTMCIPSIAQSNVADMAMACIEGLHLYSTSARRRQLFSELRKIEHESTGDSLVPAVVWHTFFEWLFLQEEWFFEMFKPLLQRKTLRLDLMREENWFPALIDICLTRSATSKHHQLLEDIYQIALFKHTPMYTHLRGKWLVLLEKGTV